METAKRSRVLRFVALGVVGAVLGTVALLDERARENALADVRAVADRFEAPDGFEVVSTGSEKGRLCWIVWGCESIMVWMYFRATEHRDEICEGLQAAVAQIAEVEEDGTCTVRGSAGDVRVRAQFLTARGRRIVANSHNEQPLQLHVQFSTDNPSS